MLRQMWKKEGLFCSGCDSGSNCCDTNGDGAHRCSNGTFGNSIDDGKSGKQVQCGQADLQTAGDKRL